MPDFSPDDLEAEARADEIGSHHGAAASRAQRLKDTCSHCGLATVPGRICTACEVAGTDQIEELESLRRSGLVPLPYRVDAYCSGGWQHIASFVSEGDAYEWAERYASVLGARVWLDGECLGVSYGPRSWHAPPHNRNCDGKPCECGAVPPLGSMARGVR